MAGSEILASLIPILLSSCSLLDLFTITALVASKGAGGFLCFDIDGCTIMKSAMDD